MKRNPLFRAREARLPLTILASAVAGLMAMAAHTQAADLTGTAALTTDYVWRGSSQTQGDPAVQAGFKIAGENGLYASAWGSNVKFDGSDAHGEFDFTVGWGKALNDDWALDVNVLRYQYPATAIGLNWTELNATATYKGNYWAALGHSNQALGYDASGSYAQVGAKFPIRDAFRVETSLGHYFLDAGVVARNGYSHGSVSAVWACKPAVELRVSAHAIDADGEALFGKQATGTRIEAALQASF